VIRTFSTLITLLGRHFISKELTLQFFFDDSLSEKMRLQVTFMQGHTVLTFPGLRFGNRLTDMPIKDK